MIGVGRSRMYEYIQQGIIPHIRIGKSIRIPKRALESWVENYYSASDKDNGQE
ncbi:MAG: helix-turn-helix domain-containing protein [Chloroflexi bacterium]|nr:helix-turn-helix domain-containing protein [Chloroflexota bacterium]